MRSFKHQMAHRIPRIAIAFLATLFLQYPSLLFLTHTQNKVQTIHQFCKWDCGTYSNLTNDLVPSAFFPFFPVLSKVIVFFTHLDPVTSNFILGAALTLGAGVSLLYLGDSIWKHSDHSPVFGFKRESMILLAAVSLFPQHHFALSGYPESLFLILFALGWLAFWNERFLGAALAFGLTAVTRAQGIWVVGIMGVFALIQVFKQKKEVGRWVLFGVLLSIPFLALLYWNESVTGNALFFLNEQNKWGRSFSLWSGIKNHIPRYDDSRFLLYCALGLSYAGLRKHTDHRWSLLIATVLSFSEIPVFYGGFYSYTRFASINLGLFVLASEVFATRPAVFFVWIIWSLSRLGTSALTYMAGGWAG